MQTTRMFAYQKPSRVETLLDALVQERGQLPSQVLKVIDRSQLPSTLQKVVFRTQKSGQVWRAWTNADQIWLFVAEMSLELARERGSPVLQVGIFREDGKLHRSQVWVHLKDGTWQQCVL
jgi:hypothetical protein